MKDLAVCIVGGESLLGRELRDQLKETNFPGKVNAVGSDEESGGFISEDEGEPTIIPALEAQRLEDASLVFFAGSPNSTLRAWELLQKRADLPVIIDLTYALDDRPNARVRSPLIEPEEYAPPAGAIHIVAHPAASIIAAVLRRVQKSFPIVHSVVEVFEPASERGQPGLNELQQQTTSLLAFKTLSKEVYDAQLSYNMLPRYGEDAPQSLENVEQRIDRHLASLLASENRVPLPSLRLIQAPVFHGYSISFWVQFEKRPALTALAEAIASAQIEVRSADTEPPTNVGAAGQPGVTLGLLQADRNHPTAVWMWSAADNFRIAVDTAIEVARRSVPGVRT
jgi:aspartate-semialdehyde dehydrogenase